MLLELHVRNFALIEQADLMFREGLTVLSGETGAGKSILIDSISAALGAQAGKDLIRTGAEYAYIELLFSVEGEERRREIQDLGQRLEVARLLQNQSTYTEIVEKTGVSTATIGRVNRALNYGAGGYQLVLDRIAEKENEE